tara:strand:- start:850 stop:1143 length:294 start_codon:yes stop_codon:yes gene_type:complete
MKKELENALNNTAPMWDNHNQKVKVGSFIYENRTYSFIMQANKLNIRCTDLLPGQTDDFNNHPNLNVDFHRISDKMDSEELCNFLDTGLFDSYVVSL